MSHLTPMSSARLSDLMAKGTVELVDIREADEYAREHIASARSQPLSALPSVLEASGKTVVFTCRSGNRTAANAQRLAACANKEGSVPAYVLEGGVDGWKKAGFATRIDRTKPVDMMRQVQMIAGGLILLGVALGTWVHPAFYGLSAFVGAGLFVAGSTGFCGMARLLAYAPWNRRNA
ncbi:rhodanese family protein [Brevundimonas sp.]|uniref:rhodanese family protein n=1 Tax=Brevundimonas sp. TaxID=1871086 RepID=UPI002FCB27A4